MSQRSQDRMAKINELDGLILQNNEKLDALLCELGWKRDTVQEGVAMATCPINPNHRVPATTLDKHIASCKWMEKGFSKEDVVKQLPSSHFYYKNSLSIVPVLIDQSTQSRILQPVSGSSGGDKAVPLNMDRERYELTSEERLAIYEYVVDMAKKTNKQSSISSSELAFDPAGLLNKEQKKEPMTHKEMLAELRDYKRRRQSYRGKNVHITKRSQTEVMREIIDAYMEMITGSQNDNDIKTDESQSETSRSPTRSNRGERSQSPDRWRSHDRGQRSRREYSRDKYHSMEGSSSRDRSRYERRERDKYSDEDRHYRDYDRYKRSHYDDRPRTQQKYRKFTE
ncbi:U11/U12 small nuclear ribonucleoprotein 48 kDa protein-like [Ptychodera flava]|uniref:U11/U12 small nuclear ribonucleoprotein 48 kDa protein-like n=1 Tax=Ptychodera flava TaxID=63121 RepID=UPI00396A38BD